MPKEKTIKEHQTYTSGYHLKIMRNITKKDIVVLCDDLNKTFGDGYDFRPEAINEGGILFHDFPGKSGNMYKTIRFSSGRTPRWPIINQQSVMDDWKENDTQIFVSNNFYEERYATKISTFLKAFHGAPCWTKSELEKFEKCFESVGFKKYGKYPTTKNLKE